MRIHTDRGTTPLVMLEFDSSEHSDMLMLLVWLIWIVHATVCLQHLHSFRDMQLSA